MISLISGVPFVSGCELLLPKKPRKARKLQLREFKVGELLIDMVQHVVDDDESNI
jgi:hypothetical protein